MNVAVRVGAEGDHWTSAEMPCPTVERHEAAAGAGPDAGGPPTVGRPLILAGEHSSAARLGVIARACGPAPPNATPECDPG